MNRHKKMNRHIELALRTWYPKDDPLHWAKEPAFAGLFGEAGEVVDLIKKAKYKGKQPVSRDRFLEECGDFWYYLRIVAYQNDYNLAAAIDESANLALDFLNENDLLRNAIDMGVRVAIIISYDICMIEDVLGKLILMLNLFECTLDELTDLNYVKLAGGKHGWKEHKNAN